MGNNRSKNTAIERALAAALRSDGRRFALHARYLPGSPDFVFLEAQVAVFVDGDFWHGWRLPAWERKLSRFWREKLRRNRRRDVSAHRKLRHHGWKVVRIWEHQLDKNMPHCLQRVGSAVDARLAGHPGSEQRSRRLRAQTARPVGAANGR
jgi:DNA mismatch endonuclease (patch repair protein)